MWAPNLRREAAEQENRTFDPLTQAAAQRGRPRPGMRRAGPVGTGARRRQLRDQSGGSLAFVPLTRSGLEG